MNFNLQHSKNHKIKKLLPGNYKLLNFTKERIHPKRAQGGMKRHAHSSPV